jgi:hypothetical protein
MNANGAALALAAATHAIARTTATAAGPHALIEVLPIGGHFRPLADARR